MQEKGHDPDPKNTGRWTKEEHQKFMYGTNAPKQPSCSTAKTGRRSSNTLEVGAEAKFEVTLRSSSTSSKSRTRPRRAVKSAKHGNNGREEV